MRGHQVLAGHHLHDGTLHVLLETQVTVGHDTHQMTLAIHYRYATDMVLGHEGKRILYSPIATDGHGVVDHTILGTLHDGHLTSLFLDAHILMDHTDTAFTGDGNSHGRFGDSVHSGCHKRNLEFDVAREARGQLHCAGQHF